MSATDNDHKDMVLRKVKLKEAAVRQDMASSYSHDSIVKRSGGRFTDLVKRTYRVLLTRGLKGCYVYFEDEATRERVTNSVSL